MKFAALIPFLTILFSGCSHVAEKEVFKVNILRKQFDSNHEYLETLALRDFDNSRDHSIYAYPLTKAYLSSFVGLFQQQPEIEKFAQTKEVIGQCFALKIEARNLGREEVDLEKWRVEFVQRTQALPLSFVRIPGVSPRRSVKHRITQRGRETWWINENFVCSDVKLNLEQDFRLDVSRLNRPAEDSYKLNWYVL